MTVSALTLPDALGEETASEVPMMAKLRMAHLKKALRANPNASADLPDTSYRRYISGDFPWVVNWLLVYPDILRALLADAKEMTPSERDALAATFSERRDRFKEARGRKEGDA